MDDFLDDLSIMEKLQRTIDIVSLREDDGAKELVRCMKKAVVKMKLRGES